jgi:hypothetical protein
MGGKPSTITKEEMAMAMMMMMTTTPPPVDVPRHQTQHLQRQVSMMA